MTVSTYSAKARKFMLPEATLRSTISVVERVDDATCTYEECLINCRDELDPELPIAPTVKESCRVAEGTVSMLAIASM